MTLYTINLATEDAEDAALALELAARNITADTLFQETLHNLLTGLVAASRQADVAKVVDALKTATDAEVDSVKTALNIQFQPKKSKV